MDNKAMEIALRQAEDISKNTVRKPNKLKQKFQISVSDLGNPDSIKSNILTHVMAEDYQRAIDDLKEFAESKSDYPKFKVRTSRYINYCIDLVHGIKAKRSFPGIGSLAMSKQKELFEKAMRHVEDLKATLGKIEKIEKEVKLEDIRSTVWVIKAAVYCLFAFLVMAFLLEVSRGALPAAVSLVESYSGDATNWLFNTLGI